MDALLIQDSTFWDVKSADMGFIVVAGIEIRFHVHLTQSHKTTHVYVFCLSGGNAFTVY